MKWLVLLVAAFASLMILFLYLGFCLDCADKVLNFFQKVSNKKNYFK